jgi:hypothetical protein
MNTHQTAVQHAEENGRHPSPSPDIQEWTECQDFILAMKGNSLGQLPINMNSLRHFKAEIHDVLTATTKCNNKIEQQLLKFNTHWVDVCRKAELMRNEMAAQTTAPVAKLKTASLAEKREVMRYMHIIPPAVCAAILGTSEDAVNKMKDSTDSTCKPILGENYAGSHCYSMEELNLIANNLAWTYAPVYANKHAIVELDDATALDQVVMVDIQTAMAMTDTTAGELTELAPPTLHSRRPYRLADLEKIRVAKLAATKH